MKVTDIEVIAHRQKPNPNPIRDALQSLPGAGSVQVTVHTDAEYPASVRPVSAG